MVPLFAILTALLAVCNARVTFNHSAVLDEYDFAGQSSVSVLGLCSDQCHIYASITPESRKLADNILVQTGKGFASIAAIADLRESTTNKKLFLEVNNAPTLSIINGNAGGAAGPLVLYIVNKAGAYYGGAEVYEAEGLDRPPAMVQAITVLSARPFTLTEANYAPMGVLARLTGFDALGYKTDACPNLYYLLSAPFPGFTITVNAPIVSLLYDVQQFHFPAGELVATIGVRNSHQMEQSGFFNSPGYHGCAGKAAYRSSLYDMATPIVQQLTDMLSQDVSISVLTNSDDAHAFVVKGAAGNELGRFHDTGDITPVVGKYTDSTLNFEWTPQPDTYFMVRYNSTA